MIVIEMNHGSRAPRRWRQRRRDFPSQGGCKVGRGYTMDELRNEITGGATPASFEPTIDYVVTKVPRFAFEKFPQPIRT